MAFLHIARDVAVILHLERFERTSLSIALRLCTVTLLRLKKVDYIHAKMQSSSGKCSHF